MVLLLLVALAFGDNTNGGLGYPCKASELSQYTKCKGNRSTWVNGENEDVTSRADCYAKCVGLKYEYFGWNSDETFCRCYTCNNGPKLSDKKPYPGTYGKNLLFKATNDEAGWCNEVAESGSACDMHKALDGTRCVSNDDCDSGKCCENYKVCGDQASGTQIAIEGKAYNSASGQWDLVINWDTWACSQVGSAQVQVATSANQCGMPTWAYGMFALLIVNPVVLLWSQRQKGDEYRNLLDEQ